MVYYINKYIYICCFAGDASGQRCHQNKTMGDDGGLTTGEARLLGGCASVVARMHCVRACYIYVYIYIYVLRCRRMLAARGADTKKTAGDDGGLATGEAPGQSR